MRDIIILPIEPLDDDYDTIPQYQLFNAEDFSGELLKEDAKRVASIYLNGSTWEFLHSDKEPTYDSPDGELPSHNNNEISEVKRVASHFLGSDLNFFRIRLALEVA
jgi:hypothetical protein